MARSQSVGRNTEMRLNGAALATTYTIYISVLPVTHVLCDYRGHSARGKVPEWLARGIGQRSVNV